VYDATWGRLFALGYDRFQQAAEKAGMREIRRGVLASASGRTLEIGAGSGLNHDLYPETVTELVLSEPFGPMVKQLRKHTAGSGPDIEVVQAPGENLPFPDSSFDTVTLTMVLCTAPDPASVLAEAARVLRPGGNLLFLEHVRSPEQGLARWQDRLHGPWYVFGHGCHCNRDSLRTIEQSPLELEHSERGAIPRTVPLVRPMVTGSARAGS
jgi:ubiquinone/menaquinone biosynthesis C-methylase UbiE